MSQTFLKSILFFVASISVVACTKSGETSRKVTCKDGVLRGAGIVGGEPLSDESWLSQGIVMVLTKSSDDTAELCTGSLIDDNIVLTAAHCVNERKSAEDVVIAFSVDPICNIVAKNRHDLVRPADSVIHHENYVSASSGNDIAMIRFKGKAPSNAHVMPLLFSARVLPTDIFVAGYGNENDYGLKNSPTRLKMAKVTRYLRRGGDNPDTDETSDNQRRIVSLDQRSGQGACSGDSGGPAMIQDGDFFTVIGVASRGVGLNKPFRRQEDVTCKQGSEYTSLNYYQEWIGNNYNSLKNENSRGRLLLR